MTAVAITPCRILIGGMLARGGAILAAGYCAAVGIQYVSSAKRTPLLATVPNTAFLLAISYSGTRILDAMSPDDTRAYLILGTSCVGLLSTASCLRRGRREIPHGPLVGHRGRGVWEGPDGTYMWKSGTLTCPDGKRIPCGEISVPSVIYSRQPKGKMEACETARKYKDEAYL